MEVMPVRLVADPNSATTLGLQFDEVRRIRYRRFHERLPFCFTSVDLPPRMEAYLASAVFLWKPLAQSPETVLGILDRRQARPIMGTKQIVSAVPVPNEIENYIDCVSANL